MQNDKVEMAHEPLKIEPKEVKKETPKKELPTWNFPLQGRTVRAKNLTEAIKKIK